MATAKVNTKTVTTTVEVPDGVTLTLTPEEAQIIFNYAARCSGVGPFRKASDAVWAALRPCVKCDNLGYPAMPWGFRDGIVHVEKGD